MSLSKELDRRDSPIRQFMEGYFPVVSSICDEIAARVKTTATIRPGEGGDQPPWGQIGMAVGYRLGFGTGGQTLDLAVSGAYSAGPVHVELMKQVQEEVEAFGGAAGVGRLTQKEENRFARLCWAAALYETLFRVGTDIDTPLWTLPAKATLADLLKLANARWIADVGAQTAAAWTALVEPFADVPREERLPGVTFDGSLAVGGADCDLLLGGCLIEIKATVRPRPERVWPYQLAGYALLDFGDRYHISEVAFYLPRQALLLRWPLESFLRRMTEYDRSKGLSRPAVELAAVRQSLKERIGEVL